MADRDHTGALARGAAVAGPVAIGAALYPFRTHVSPANLALAFVVGVVAVAGTGRRGAAATAAVMSSLSFDFFLTRPYLSLRITGSANVTTTLLLLVVGLAVGELAARGLRARHGARASSDRLQRIHGLAERISGGETPDFIVIAVADQLRDLLTLRDCSFSFDPPTDIGARIEPDGSVTMAGRVWPAEKLGLPTRRVELPVRGGGAVVASFVLTPTPARAVELEQRVVAVALADQLGAALMSRRSAN
jgi:K+-sensing histidine kinase KdpD